MMVISNDPERRGLFIIKGICSKGRQYHDSPQSIKRKLERSNTFSFLFFIYNTMLIITREQAMCIIFLQRIQRAKYC
jgi:hypothetical protein